MTHNLGKPIGSYLRGTRFKTLLASLCMHTILLGFSLIFTMFEYTLHLNLFVSHNFFHTENLHDTARRDRVVRPSRQSRVNPNRAVCRPSRAKPDRAVRDDYACLPTEPCRRPCARIVTRDRAVRACPGSRPNRAGIHGCADPGPRSSPARVRVHACPDPRSCTQSAVRASRPVQNQTK